jgi:tryptophanyl-tRNA synthetase
MTATFKPQVFSGVQPTGNLHLGNYLGAIRKFVALQNEHDCIFCVVDLHSITVNPTPKELIDGTRSIAAAFIASGIDPVKHIVFNQSRCLSARRACLGLQLRGPHGLAEPDDPVQGKGRQGPRERLGRSFAYPSLMAADILLYRATHVPVGDDQKQHLELTRDIAQKFNIDFSDRIKAARSRC